MRLLLRFGAAATTLVCLAQPAAAQSSRFDGTWSVEVVTERGTCDRAYRYAVIVDRGRLRYGGREAFDVSGRVQRNGAVTARISRGRDRADIRGRLEGTFGSGTWGTQGSRVCAGRWNAERRG